jgi:hypothetical protein
MGLDDQAKAVAKRDAVEPAARPALQRRCKFGGTARLSVRLNGNAATNQKRQSPCNKDFGVSRRSMSSSGKMEAAGIEPASRDISVGASTCVVG